MPAGGLGEGIGGAVGGIAVLAGAAGQGGGKYYKEALKVWKKLQTSDFDFRSLSAPELRVVAEQMPQLWDAAVPEDVKTIVESPETRNAQMAALGRTEEVAREGLPAIDRIAAQQTQRALASENTRANESVLRNMAARGQLGGGDEIQARLAANQGGANQARDMAQDLVREQLLRRMAANSEAGQMASNVRGQDVAVAGQNANFVNNYNQMVANMRNQAAASNAAAKTGAQAANASNKQQISNINTENKYNVDLANLERQNRLKGDVFGQNLNIAQGLSGAYNTYGGYQDAQQKKKADAITNIGQGVGGIAGGAFGF